MKWAQNLHVCRHVDHISANVMCSGRRDTRPPRDVTSGGTTCRYLHRRDGGSPPQTLCRDGRLVASVALCEWEEERRYGDEKLQCDDAVERCES